MTNCKRDSLGLIVIALIAAGVLIGSAVVLVSVDLSAPWRIAVALLPFPFYVVMFVVAVRTTRRLDELKQRIQLEALAVTVVGTLLATSGHGMLMSADVGVPALEWGGIWVIATLFYVAGTVTAWRRYR